MIRSSGPSAVWRFGGRLRDLSPWVVVRFGCLASWSCVGRSYGGDVPYVTDTSGEERSGQKGGMEEKVEQRKNHGAMRENLTRVIINGAVRTSPGLRCNRAVAILALAWQPGPHAWKPRVSLSHFRAGAVAAARLRSSVGSRRLPACAVCPLVAFRVCP